MKRSHKRIVEKLLKESNFEYFVVTCSTNFRQSNVDIAPVMSTSRMTLEDVFDEFTGGPPYQDSEFFRTQEPHFLAVGTRESEQEDQMAFNQLFGYFVTDDHGAANRVEGNWRGRIASIKNEGDFKNLLIMAR